MLLQKLIIPDTHTFYVLKDSSKSFIYKLIRKSDNLSSTVFASGVTHYYFKKNPEELQKSLDTIISRQYVII